jgi:hypothetical protein
MEKTAASLPLPDHLLDLANEKGLIVEAGAVLFESDIGGGLLSHTWLTQQEQGVCLLSGIISPVEGGKDEYEELQQATLSEPIGEGVAASVLERWGLLKQLEVSFDAQMTKTRWSRKAHDSDMENDNL